MNFNQDKDGNSTWTCHWRGFQIAVYYSASGRIVAFVHAKGGMLNQWHSREEVVEYIKEIKKVILLWARVFKDGIGLKDYLNKANI